MGEKISVEEQIAWYETFAICNDCKKSHVARGEKHPRCPMWDATFASLRRLAKLETMYEAAKIFRHDNCACPLCVALAALEVER